MPDQFSLCSSASPARRAPAPISPACDDAPSASQLLRSSVPDWRRCLQATAALQTACSAGATGRATSGGRAPSRARQLTVYSQSACLAEWPGTRLRQAVMQLGASRRGGALEQARLARVATWTLGHAIGRPLALRTSARQGCSAVESQGPLPRCSAVRGLLLQQETHLRRKPLVRSAPCYRPSCVRFWDVTTPSTERQSAPQVRVACHADARRGCQLAPSPQTAAHNMPPGRPPARSPSGVCRSAMVPLTLKPQTFRSPHASGQSSYTAARGPRRRRPRR